LNKEAVEEAVLLSGSDAEWIRIACPWCGHETKNKRNMSVAQESSYYFCHRCQVKGFYAPKVRTLETIKVAPALQFDDDDISMKLPWEFKPLHMTPQLREDEEYWDYVVGRGVHPETIVEFGIGYCATGFYARSVVVPFYRGQSLVGFVAKNLDDGQYRYPKGFRREFVFFNHNRMYDDAPVVVVEGVFDALPHVPHTIATLGKPTHYHIKMIEDNHESGIFDGKVYYFMLDGDARAENWAAVQRLKLKGVPARLVKVPSGKDPGNLSVDEFYSLIQEAK
jgi:hypothetical protein